MRLNDMAKIIKTAGEPSRLKILCELFERKNICVSDLAKLDRASPAITSHHLRAMSKVGITRPVRHGKKICYEIKPSPFTNDLKKLICKYKNNE